MDESAENSLAERLVHKLHHPEGSFEQRPVHSLGIGAAGHFIASPVARNYCRASHFELFPPDDAGASPGGGGYRKPQPRHTPVTVRFSNGSGSAIRRDGWSDVRGMATRFHLPDGTQTDLVAMTLPEFFTQDGPQFEEFADEAFPKPYHRQSPWLKILDMLRLTPPKRNPYPDETISPDDGAIAYADAHPFARLGVFEAAAIGAPANYLRAAYHAVHTFIVTAPDGVRRWVRFKWQPIDGVLKTDPRNPADKDTLTTDFLDKRLRDRLREGPSRFSLMMAIGETGDMFEDCSRPWPPHRERINMGTLVVERVLDGEAEADRIERMGFNPWNLTDGIEASGDPVLSVRRHAYTFSHSERNKRRGPSACPMAGG